MAVPKPLWLLAELTYRCPLQCPYCSNPLDFAGARFQRELATEEWCRVFREAKALGVLQLGLSGGEPTLRSRVHGPTTIRSRPIATRGSWGSRSP